MSGCTCAPAARRWTSSGCSSCGVAPLESQLTPALLKILCAPGSGLVLWRNARGFDERTKNAYGLADGAADYIGLWAPSGRFVAIEFKTRSGRQAANQKAFARLVDKQGGAYFLVRCPEDARDVLQMLTVCGEA